MRSGVRVSLVRGSWVLIAMTFALVAASRVALAAEPEQDQDWKRGSGFGVSVLGGFGYGGQGHEVTASSTGFRDGDMGWRNQFQWVVGGRLLSPHLGSAGNAPRLFLRGMVVAPFGDATEEIFTNEVLSPVKGKTKLDYRWLVGVGLEVPIQDDGETVFLLSPSVSYARERSTFKYEAIGAPGVIFSEARDQLEVNQVVPGLELSVPVARWGPLGRMGGTGNGRFDIVVGVDVPFSVSRRKKTTVLGTTGSGVPISITSKRDLVGYSAYAGARVLFDGF